MLGSPLVLNTVWTKFVFTVLTKTSWDMSTLYSSAGKKLQMIQARIKILLCVIRFKLNNLLTFLIVSARKDSADSQFWGKRNAKSSPYCRNGISNIKMWRRYTVIALKSRNCVFFPSLPLGDALYFKTTYRPLLNVDVADINLLVQKHILVIIWKKAWTDEETFNDYCKWP